LEKIDCKECSPGKILICELKSSDRTGIPDMVDYETYQELLENEEKFRKTADAAHDAIVFLDDGGYITYWNKAAERIFGYSREEVLGKEAHVLLVPDRYREAYRRGFERFKDTGNGDVVGKTMELEAIRRDGTGFPVEISVLSVKMRGKWNAIGILRDITKRKEIENALLETKKRSQEVLDNTTAVIYIKDLEGKYILINRQFEKLFNVSRKLIEGKTDYDIFPKEMADAFRKNDLKVLEENCSIEFEEVAPLDDGLHTYISVKLPLKSEQGVPYAICGISTDITERKRTEEELIKYRNHLEELVEERTSELKRINEKLQREISEREKMETALVQLNEVLSLLNKNLRHDVLNDLTVVINSIEMYEEVEDKKLLDTALKYVKKSVGLIKKMRELESLVTSGAGLKPIGIKEVIENSIKNYNINFEIEGKCTVIADEALGSVIDNVIRNAIVHGRADKIDVEIKEFDDYCEIKISDNGKGIPDEVKDKIFEESYSYGDSGGSGLGLYIVRRTIERYGGQIKVENNKPRGTRFIIRLKSGVES